MVFCIASYVSCLRHSISWLSSSPRIEIRGYKIERAYGSHLRLIYGLGDIVAAIQRRSLDQSCNNARLDDQVGQGLQSVEKKHTNRLRAVGLIHIFLTQSHPRPHTYHRRSYTQRRSLGESCNNARLNDQVGQGFQSVEKKAY